MKVKSVYAAGYADVYNMEVEDTHDFVVENGIVVHNCYDELRYVCMKNPIAPPPRRKEAEKPYNPLSTDDEMRYGRYDWYAKH